MDTVVVFETESAIVRIHPGKRSAAEAQAAWKESAERFFWQIEKEKRKGE